MAEQEEERIMVIPLRAAWAASRTDRTPPAIKAIREHVQQHLKPDRIFIDDILNEYLRKRGREHPPRRIRAKATKFEDGSAAASPPEDWGTPFPRRLETAGTPSTGVFGAAND